MATALNQHKAIAMGKKPNPSPAGIAKFKKGGVVEKHEDIAEDKKIIKSMVKKEALMKKGGKVCK